jgi:hypothetical protein
MVLFGSGLLLAAVASLFTSFVDPAVPACAAAPFAGVGDVVPALLALLDPGCPVPFWTAAGGLLSLLGVLVGAVGVARDLFSEPDLG